jgi:signal transduction histidine kinase
LGADAVVAVEIRPGGARRVLEIDGLSLAEANRVLRTLTSRARSARDERTGIPAFSRVVYDEVHEAGIGAAAICALQRARRRFKNTGLTPTFARHLAISAAIRRPGWQRDPARRLARAWDHDGAAAILGLWELEQGGYEALHRALADELDATTGATRLGVLVWDEWENLLRPIPGAFGTDPEELPAAHDLDDWSSSAARVFASGEPYVTNSADDDAGVLKDHVDTVGFRRLLTVPLHIGAHRVGVLQLADKPTDYTLADVRAVSGLASWVAVCVRVARMRHALLLRERLEEVLAQVAIDIASGRDHQDFLGSTLDALCAALAGSMIAVVPAAANPLIRRRGPVRRTLEEMVLRHSREAKTLRVYAAGPSKPGSLGWAALHVPVRLDGAQVATLTVLRTGGDAFNQVECRALSRFAHLVALAWATEQYQRHLAECARVTERQRIADELHDNVAQLLFAARLSLDFALEIPGLPDGALSSVQHARELLPRAEAATRTLIERNSSTGEDHLSDRLAALVDSIEEEFARPVVLEIASGAVEAANMMSRSATNLVARATREALVNAAKHAGPCQLAVRVTVTRRHRLLLTVTDTGIGVGARREDGYGTAALRRAVRRHGGVLRVNSVATGGTQVAVSLPL